MAQAEWELVYWASFPGRGDFVRLLFEEAGVGYKDVCKKAGDSEVLKYIQRGQNTSLPSLVPPIVRRGDFVLSQTPAILLYLGKEFGLYPKGGPEQEAVALQWALTAADYLEEGQNSFHPVRRSGTHDSQKEEAVAYIERFKEERLPKFMDRFEKALLSNKGGNHFFIGDQLTYVDIAMFHVLRATEFQFPEEYKSLSIPTLRAFSDRMKQRPNIKAFLESERSLPFSGSSMM